MTGLVHVLFSVMGTGCVFIFTQLGICQRGTVAELGLPFTDWGEGFRYGLLVQCLHSVE